MQTLLVLIFGVPNCKIVLFSEWQNTFPPHNKTRDSKFEVFLFYPQKYFVEPNFKNLNKLLII